MLAFGCLQLSGAGAASNSVAVNMDKYVVMAARYHWSYAKTAHFEILSSLKDTDFAAQVIQQAERVIAVFEKNSPLFQLNRDLPIKLILIDDEGVARFFTDSGNNMDQEAIDNPKRTPGNPNGIPQLAKPAFAVDGEQVCATHLITNTYMKSMLSYNAKVTENAYQIIVAYLKCCLVQKKIDPKNMYTLPFNYMPLLSYLRFFRMPSAENNPRVLWLTSDKRHLALGRYNSFFESYAITRRVNEDEIENIYYDLHNNPGLLQAMNTTAGNTMQTPYLGLKAVLERKRPPVWPGHGSPTGAFTFYFTYCREMTDFAYYCVFGTNQQARQAFARLVQDSGKRPVDEDMFMEYFGTGYAQFHAEMYDFFQKHGQGDTDYAGSAWGGPEITVWKFDPKNPSAPVVLRDAERNESARIISDWFALNKKDLTARNTLLLAREDAPHVMQDMDFVATFGINDAASILGDKAGALKFLEQAADAKIARPRVYRELSKLRLENIKAAREWGHKLDADELKSVMDPLLVALRMSRPNPDTYLQIMEVTRNIGGDVPKESLEILAEGCRQFPDNIELLGEVVPLLLAQGMQSTAAGLIENASNSILTDNESDRLDRLKDIVARQK